MTSAKSKAPSRRTVWIFHSPDRNSGQPGVSTLVISLHTMLLCGDEGLASTAPQLFLVSGRLGGNQPPESGRCAILDMLRVEVCIAAAQLADARQIGDCSVHIPDDFLRNLGQHPVILAGVQHGSAECAGGCIDGFDGPRRSLGSSLRAGPGCRGSWLRAF